jgi:branched-chain amino acid transport system permease protein
MAFNAAWTGRAWVAIGMNRRLAGTLGINAFRYKIAAFVLASAIAGLVGSFYAHYMTFIHPNTFGIWTVVYIQIYAIMGGIGHVIAGPLIGAAIMTFFPELIRQTQNLAPLIVGLLLIVLIIFLPQGLLSIPQRWPILTIWLSKLGNAIKSRLSRIRTENT